MTIALSCPESWRQLTLDQLRAVAELEGLALTKSERLLILFCRFTGIKGNSRGHFVTSDGKEFDLTASELENFCSSLAFIHDEKPLDIVNPTTVNGHLMDTKFGDYFKANVLLSRFDANDPDLALVLKALGLLGDKREEITMTEASMVLLWWTGVQRWLVNKYPNVLKDRENNSEPCSPMEARKNIMLMLNQGRPQDNEAIEEANVHDVLAAVEFHIEEANRLRERMKP